MVWLLGEGMLLEWCRSVMVVLCKVKISELSGVVMWLLSGSLDLRLLLKLV